MQEGIKEVIAAVDPTLYTNGIHDLSILTETLSQAQMNRPKLMANSIGMLMDIFQENMGSTPKQRWHDILDVITVTFESYPAIFKKNFNKVQRVLNLYIKTMASVDAQLSEFWMHPDEGTDFDDYEAIINKDIDSAIIIQTRPLFDRVISVYGYQKCLQNCLPKLKADIHHTDWRWRAAVLMAASQFSECDLQINQNHFLTELISIFFSKANDPHPAVRFASIHAIGQFADDLRPDFQNNYSEQFIQVFLNGFEDPVERVAAHWIASFTNFFEDYQNSTFLKPYLPKIVEAVIYYINNGNSTIKENSISMLATLGTIQDLFTPEDIRKPFEICNMVFQNFQLNGPFKQFVNQTLECASIFLSTYISICSEFLPELLMIMENFGESFSPCYFCSAWQRILLCKLPIPQWKVLYARVIKMANEAEEQQLKDILPSIEFTAVHLKSEFNSVCADTLSFLSKIITEKTENEDLIQRTVECITEILTKTAPANPDDNWYVLIYSTLGLMLNSLQKLLQEESYGPISQIYRAFTLIMNEYKNLLTPEQAYQLLNMLMNYTVTLQSVKKGVFEQQKDDEMDEELEDLTKNSIIENINQCIVKAPDAYFIMLNQIPPELKVDTSVRLIQITFDSFQQEGKKDEDLIYGFNMLRNVIQAVDYGLISDYMATFYQMISGGVGSPNPSLRSAAIQAFEIFIKVIPSASVSKEIVNEWAGKINQAFLDPCVDNAPQKNVNNMKETCVCTIGAIIQHHPNTFHLYEGWINKLPLRNNKELSQQQFQILLQTYQSYLNNQAVVSPVNIIQACRKVLITLLRWRNLFQKKLKAQQYSGVLKELKIKIKHAVTVLCNQEPSQGFQQKVQGYLSSSDKVVLKQVFEENE